MWKYIIWEKMELLSKNRYFEVLETEDYKQIIEKRKEIHNFKAYSLKVLDHVAAMKLDWGKLGQKIGASFMAYIQAKVVKAMASVITANTSPAAFTTNPNGIAGYIANGMTTENWLTTARNVELANGGSEVYALGTKLALADVLPEESATSGFRYGEDGHIVKDGFLPSYKGVALLELGNALVPNTVNGKPEVVVPDDIIYMIPMGKDKPVCDLLLEEIHNSNVA